MVGHSPFKRSIRTGSIPSAPTISRCSLLGRHGVWDADQASSILVTSTEDPGA